MNTIAHLHFTTSNNTIYYRYRLPSGSYEPLGKDRRLAELAAIGMNARRDNEIKVNNLPVSGNGKTIGDLISLYEEVKLRSTKSKATAKEWKRKFKLYHVWMSGWKVAKVGVMDLDVLLEEKALTYDTYRLHRLLFAELFTYALGKGWRREIDGNPGKSLLPPKLARIKGAKIRKRMSLEVFNAIRKEAPQWLTLAMDLALHIGIRRGDICHLKLSDFREGCLFFIPSKTADMLSPVAIKIPLTAALKELVRKSRLMTPLSPYFLHRSNSYVRTAMAEERQHITQIIPEQLTRYFKKARDKAVNNNPGLFKVYKTEELPTYHEVRSLCAKLYQQQGRDRKDIQLLLGHADESMTQFYQEGYGVEWQEARAGLELS